MSKTEESIRSIQKALDLSRSVQTLDGADKDYVEEQLEAALGLFEHGAKRRL